MSVKRRCTYDLYMLEEAPTEGVVDGPDRLSSLSQRELEVVEMASEGLTNAQIAVNLEVSVHAVKFHLASIYRKLDVGNRTEAAVTYLRSRPVKSRA